MLLLKKIELTSMSDIHEFRESVFFNELILPQAKSDSLIAIFKIEHGLALTNDEVTKLNMHLKFSGAKTIREEFIK